MTIERTITSEKDSFYDPSFDGKKQMELWVRDIVEDDEVLMSKTSFNVAANIAQYIQLNRSDNREAYHTLTEADIKGHSLEFSMGEPVVPYEIAKGNVNGEPVVLTRHYITGEYVPLLSLLNPNERAGAVQRRTRLFGKLLENAEPGSKFFLTSPDGWHGLGGDESVAYTEYNHTQTTFCEVQQNGSLKSYTVRSSMTLAENEEFLRKMSGGRYSPLGEDASSYERIVDVVDTVVESCVARNIDQVIEIIKDIRGEQPFWTNIKYTGEKVRDWNPEEVLERLPFVDDLTQFDTLVSDVMAQFWDRVQANVKGESVDEVRLLARYIRDAVLKTSFETRTRFSDKTEREEYSVTAELSHNEGQAGCVAFINGEFGPRTVASNHGIDYPFNIRDRCRSKRKCLSGNNGMDKMLASCRFCLNCDVGIRTGKLRIEDIMREQERQVVSQETSEQPASQINVVSEGVGIVLGAIFSLS